MIRRGVYGLQKTEARRFPDNPCRCLRRAEASDFLSVPLSRILLILLVPVTVICLIVFLVANWYTLKSGQVPARVLVPVLALVFTLLPIDSQLEFARFHAA
jgi:hypothetical protein